MKSEYQIIDECTRFLIKWRSQCGAMGWYQMDENNLRAFVEKVTNEVKNNFIQSDVIKSVCDHPNKLWSTQRNMDWCNDCRKWI